MYAPFWIHPKLALLSRQRRVVTLRSAIREALAGSQRCRIRRWRGLRAQLPQD